MVEPDQVSSVLVHSCAPTLPTTRERCSEWEKKGESESVRGVENRDCGLGSGEGCRENEGECKSEESHYWVWLWGGRATTDVGGVVGDQLWQASEKTNNTFHI